MMKLRVLTLVSLLSSLYSVSSVLPKSEFLIMPNMLQPDHLFSLRSFGFFFVLPILFNLLQENNFSLDLFYMVVQIFEQPGYTVGNFWHNLGRLYAQNTRRVPESSTALAPFFRRQRLEVLTPHPFAELKDGRISLHPEG